MIRIVATVSVRQLLRARDNLQAGDPDTPKILRILKHGEVTPNGTFDVLVDRDSNDLPNAAVTFLRNRAEVIYVAEWDMQGAPAVLKGADPGYHKFAGWPC